RILGLLLLYRRQGSAIKFHFSPVSLVVLSAAVLDPQGEAGSRITERCCDELADHLPPTQRTHYHCASAESVAPSPADTRPADSSIPRGRAASCAALAHSPATSARSPEYTLRLLPACALLPCAPA